MSGLGGKTLGILAGTRAEELYLRHKVVLRTDNHIVIISCIFSLFYNDSKSPGTPFFLFQALVSGHCETKCSVLPRKFWTTRLFSPCLLFSSSRFLRRISAMAFEMTMTLHLPRVDLWRESATVSRCNETYEKTYE